MNYYKGAILTTLTAIPTGIWLEHSLPHYGFALGIGMGIAFIIGVFTDIEK